jgi:hypothetical protein
VPYGVLQCKGSAKPSIVRYVKRRAGRVVIPMHSPIMPNGNPHPPDGPDKEAILRELESILRSPFFRTSNRCKQFLSYVVQHTLEGNPEPLKERMIGAKLFQRPAGYATGDDPVVRVQAGEVRRRLEQYHHAATHPSPVRIELPVGSYAPTFQWATPDAVTPEEAPHVAAPSIAKTGWRRGRVVTACILVVLCVALLAASIFLPRKSTLKQFWSPVLSTPEPVLICLAKPRVYRPSAELYQRYAKDPGEFATEWQRLTQPPPLLPTSKLTWGDMAEYSDYGVAAGDVYAALRMSAALTRMSKESQIRIGTSYSFADLRSSPAIVVGAFNNRWTMQMTSNLHFAFVEENGKQMIREQGPTGVTWSTRFGTHGEVVEDYAVVTRLLNSKTGKFVVATAGIMADGTQAAAEFVSSSDYLDQALRTSKPDWTSKNLQFVVQTTVTDSVPGPPQVVAIYLW